MSPAPSCDSLSFTHFAPALDICDDCERVLCPPALTPGSVVRIVAPSSPFDRTLVRCGMAWLAQRYRVKFEPGLFERTGFLAGSDERRRDELNRALADPETKAVVAARGGYGLSRIAAGIDLRPLAKAPKWVVGFSDITALHIELQQAGLMSLHAHNAAGLGRGDSRTRSAWIRALEQPDETIRFGDLSTFVPGRASGPLFGGNLTVLFSCHAAGRLHLPRGAILLLEDVAETSYRIDRMLTALVSSGVLSEVAGVVLGEFADCSAGKYGVPSEEVLRDCLSQLKVPVLANLPIGHGKRNQPAVLGARAVLSSDRAELLVST